MRRIGIVAFLVLAVDLATKILVTREMPLQGVSIEVLGDFLRWTYVQNHGSAFGLFQGGRFFFIGFSLVSLVLILLLARSPRYRSPGYATALGLILGGALGNLADRILYGAVTDWIDVGVGHHRWPTFNVADVGVSVGVLVLAIKMLFGPPAEEAAPAPDPDPGRDRIASPDRLQIPETGEETDRA